MELFIVLSEFPFCQTLDGRNLWWPYKSMFLSRRSVNICTCLHLLHANIWLKSRCVEGLLLKWRAFLTNLHVHCIKTCFCKVLYIFQSIFCIFMYWYCILKLCSFWVFCIEIMRLFRRTFSLSPIWMTLCHVWQYESKSTLDFSLDFVNSRG